MDRAAAGRPAGAPCRARCGGQAERGGSRGGDMSRGRRGAPDHPRLAGPGPGARRVVDTHRRHECRSLGNPQPSPTTWRTSARQWSGIGRGCAMSSCCRRSRGGSLPATRRAGGGSGYANERSTGRRERRARARNRLRRAGRGLHAGAALQPRRNRGRGAARRLAGESPPASSKRGVRATGAPSRRASRLARPCHRARTLRGRSRRPRCGPRRRPPMRMARSAGRTGRTGGGRTSNGSSGGDSRGAASAPCMEADGARRATPGRFFSPPARRGDRPDGDPHSGSTEVFVLLLAAAGRPCGGKLPRGRGPSAPPHAGGAMAEGGLGATARTLAPRTD